MNTKTEPLTQLIREIRTCFNQLRSLAETINADLEVNPSMRAVMESLFQHAPQTVPELAEFRGTSRQHVQTVINGLLARNLVLSEENPDHKRSAFYRLTATGEAVFREIRKRELIPMQSLSEALSQPDMEAATKVLSVMNHKLNQLIKQGETK